MWNLRALLLLSLAIVTDATLAYAIKPGCEVQYQKDSQTCRSLNKDSAVKRRCWASAMERKVACEFGGGGIPPLVVD